MNLGKQAGYAKGETDGPLQESTGEPLRKEEYKDLGGGFREEEVGITRSKTGLLLPGSGSQEVQLEQWMIRTVPPPPTTPASSTLALCAHGGCEINNPSKP